MSESVKPQSLGRTLLIIGQFEWHPRICFFAPFSWWSCCCAFMPMAVGSLACHLADFCQSWALINSGKRWWYAGWWRMQSLTFGSFLRDDIVSYCHPKSFVFLHGARESSTAPVFLMNLRTLGNCQVCRLCGPWPDVRLRDPKIWGWWCTMINWLHNFQVNGRTHMYWFGGAYH